VLLGAVSCIESAVVVVVGRGLERVFLCGVRLAAVASWLWGWLCVVI